MASFIVIILFFYSDDCLRYWAYNSPVEKMTRGNGNIIPSSREQVIQSLDPGIVTEIMVKEGDMVEKDQVLMKLDDTRSSAVLRESEAKVANLEATIARLKAEAYGTKLSFPESVGPELRRREIAAYKARRQVMVDAINGYPKVKLHLIERLPLLLLLFPKVMFPKSNF